MQSLQLVLVVISVVFGFFNLVTTVALPSAHFTGTNTISNTQSDYTHQTHTHTSISSKVTEDSRLRHRAVDEAGIRSFGTGGFTRPKHTLSDVPVSAGTGLSSHTDTYWQPDTTTGVHTSYVISQVNPISTDPTWVPPPVPTSRLPLEDRSEMLPAGTHTGTLSDHTHDSTDSGRTRC